MESLRIEPKGLQRYPNQLSKAEPGSLVTAENVVLDRDGVIEMRRGLKRYGTSLTFSADKKPNGIYEFGNTILVHYDDKMARDSDGSGTFVDYSGTFSIPTGASRCRSIQAGKNFYLATSAGVKKLESTTSQFGSAGMSKALDGVASTTGATGWMTNNTQVAYRIVFGIKDSNLNLILGSPSQRVIAINSSGGTRNVSITLTVPSDITTSHFFQVYRSVMSSGVAIDPNDELGLVYEANPTAGEVAARSITFTDITPENLRGATLYTSPSQQGISQANDQPPLCRDMVMFKNHAFYFNTVSKHRFRITLIAVDGTGFVVNDTITIGGIVYTGKGTENAAAGEFLVDISGTPSDNIETTAISLVRVINKYASNTGYYAYYVSGYNDLPGQILIEERGIGGSSFALVSSRGNAWNPALPTSGTTQSSTNSTAKNGVAISKNLQQEAVPELNVLYLGAADKEILRGISLRDSLFVFKEDGVYRIVGDTVANFTPSLFDDTIELRGDETAVPFNNQAFCYSNQGVIGISETGVAVVSRNIEGDLFALSSLSNFKENAFAIPYESDRKYILFTVSDSTDTFATQAYVFNVFTNAWTGPWIMNRSCGIVKRSDDKLYLGSWDQDSRYIYQERKTFTLTDFSDEEFNISIVSFADDTLTLVSSSNLLVGDKIIQGNRFGIITSVPDGTHVVVDREQSWDPSEAVAYRPIPVACEFTPDSGANPGVLKQYTETTLFFEQAQFQSLAIGFSSNFSTSVETVDGQSVAEGPWGIFPWGLVTWGGGVPRLQPIRVFVPRRKQRCAWMNVHIEHEEAVSRFALAGMSLQFESMSERIK